MDCLRVWTLTFLCNEWHLMCCIVRISNFDLGVFGNNNILYRHSTKNKLKRGEKWVNGVSDPTPGAPRFLHFGGHWPKNFHFLHEIKRISCFFFENLRGTLASRLWSLSIGHSGIFSTLRKKSVHSIFCIWKQS